MPSSVVIHSLASLHLALRSGDPTLCFHFRVLLWGPAAVEHHKTCRSLGKSLWQEPSVGDVLRLLDRDRVMATILHFPQGRWLLPPEV